MDVPVEARIERLLIQPVLSKTAIWGDFIDRKITSKTLWDDEDPDFDEDFKHIMNSRRSHEFLHKYKIPSSMIKYYNLDKIARKHINAQVVSFSTEMYIKECSQLTNNKDRRVLSLTLLAMQVHITQLFLSTLSDEPEYPRRKSKFSFLNEDLTFKDNYSRLVLLGVEGNPSIWAKPVDDLQKHLSLVGPCVKVTYKGRDFKCYLDLASDSNAPDYIIFGKYTSIKCSIKGLDYISYQHIETEHSKTKNEHYRLCPMTYEIRIYNYTWHSHNCYYQLLKTACDLYVHGNLRKSMIDFFPHPKTIIDIISYDDTILKIVRMIMDDTRVAYRDYRDMVNGIKRLPTPTEPITVKVGGEYFYTYCESTSIECVTSKDREKWSRYFIVES